MAYRAAKIRYQLEEISSSNTDENDVKDDENTSNDKDNSEDDSKKEESHWCNRICGDVHSSSYDGGAYTIFGTGGKIYDASASCG